MLRRILVSILLCFLIQVSAAMAAPVLIADDPLMTAADQPFEKILAEALKAPEKADWKALRRAFAETSYYAPYSVEVDEKLKATAQAIGRGEIKESEAALLKLLERDRFMRFDSVALLMILYQRTDQPEKAEKYKKILDGILGVLQHPGSGSSFDNAIEVLFIQEEYLVTTNMPIKGRATFSRDGHRFDVFELTVDGDEVVRKVYFNIDLPQKSFSKGLEK